MAVRQLEAGRCEVENAYPRAVAREGNPTAQRLINQVFEPVDRQWRGIGLIPLSGLGLRQRYQVFNALNRFPLAQEPRKNQACALPGRFCAE
jgi:hydrogenase expression/formation protein HypD